MAEKKTPSKKKTTPKAEALTPFQRTIAEVEALKNPNA